MRLRRSCGSVEPISSMGPRTECTASASLLSATATDSSLLSVRTRRGAPLNMKPSAFWRTARTSLILLGPLARPSAAQSSSPRFERTTCWVDGDWAREVRRECGWLIVPESRDRAGTSTVRLAVEILRAAEPTEPPEPPRVFLHGGPGGPGGIRLYSEGIA